jgi:hypothetical protein
MMIHSSAGGGRILLLITTLLLVVLPRIVESTITLSATGKQLHSRAADFGLDFEYGLQYVALLQVSVIKLNIIVTGLKAIIIVC